MDNEYICTGNRISRMSVDLVDHREGPKFHDAFKGQPQIPFIRRSDRSCDHIYSDKKCGKFRTFTVSNVDRRITSVVSYLIEVFGLFGVEKTGFAWVKLLGVVLFVTGLIIFKWKS